ncbi:PucR family transcriptional regulator [Microvirga tunisiensis]|uniref:PucR C-terminal helix-turn-helix domain-containing protein n=1 Tax=Microvirga tunisiensis TaxID=2108360 RepID=A0A5N7MQN7_9HYPH|nr:helix-turn-helix domain-containing protein [Microvirga tunisiensis]MPR11172.1 hypothetical protein [Microvirga tunisiensis]MPR29263.1 hypothetical protein [Microvirga tunisiensis]
MKDVSNADFVNKKKQHLFSELLAGSGDSLASSLMRYRFTIKQYCQIAVIRVAETNSHSNPDVLLQMEISRLSARLGTINHYSFYSDDDLVFLFSAQTMASMEASVARLRQAIEGQRVFCGVSSVYESSMAHALHYQNAVESLNLLSSKGSFGYLQYDRIGIERLLINQPKQQIVRFADDILRPILEYGNKGPSLYSTLVTYIGTGKSVADSARCLKIHPNTLYQRLSKIEDLTGLSLSNAEDFMMLSLACHLRKAYVDDSRSRTLVRGSDILSARSRE